MVNSNGEGAMCQDTIFPLHDSVTVADVVQEYTDSLRESHTPIVIDNGSFQCRVGWACDQDPRLVFKNVLAKQRGRKDVDVIVANDISHLEVVRWQLKTQFDLSVVTRTDSQEHMLDYTFSHLGIDTCASVDHPIVVTEPLCNPNSCRQQLNELLFEAYQVPSVLWGVDGLYSLRHNQPDVRDGLIVSLGYHSACVMPVLNGHLDTPQCRRVNLGGSHLDAYMQRLLQLKYPAHNNAVTLSRCERIVSRHCHVAPNYAAALREWACGDHYLRHAHVFELPHAAVPMTSQPDPEVAAERRRCHMARLKELSERRRSDKMAADEAELQRLQGVLQLQAEDEDAFDVTLAQHGFDDVDELQDKITSLVNAVNRHKMGDSDEPRSKRAKQEADESEQLQLQAEQMERLLAGRDTAAVLADIRQKRVELLEARARRRQQRLDVAKRRTLAAQQRMKIISELAQGRQPKKDTFGANDDDWDVYKQISRDGGSSESESEQERLEQYDMMLRTYDPTFKDMASGEPPTPLDPKEFYRLYVGVERIRVPELFFQPSLLGLEQAGISETINFVLAKYASERRAALARNVFVTGACAALPGFKERLEVDLVASCPFRSEIGVSIATDPVLDAWHGAKRWANDPHLDKFVVSRADFEEMGGEYLKEHCCSNAFVATPAAALKQTDPLLHEEDGIMDLIK